MFIAKLVAFLLTWIAAGFLVAFVFNVNQREEEE